MVTVVTVHVRSGHNEGGRRRDPLHEPTATLRMSSGLRESRSFHRRQRRKRQIKWLVLLACQIGLGAFAYHTGSVLARREVVDLRNRLDRSTTDVAELQRQNAALQHTADSARRAAADLQTRYARDVPTGTRKALLDLIEKQLAAGVKPARLRFLINAAGSGQKCSGPPDTKRFLVKTPVPPAPPPSLASIAFADGSIIVTATGTAAISPEGNARAAFDPAKPVIAWFTRPGGKRTQVTGILPLYHSVVVGGTEYRFAMRPDDRRGFMRVTAERCTFP